MTEIITHLCAATIRGHELRFYRTPNKDGRPDLPWHSVDDLCRALGLNRELRRRMKSYFYEGPFEASFRTIKTADGLVVIAPHYAAQGFIGAMKECIGDVADIEREYGHASASALQKIADELKREGLRFEDGSLLAWMGKAIHRHEGTGPSND
jgi:hypothetical protein